MTLLSQSQIPSEYAHGIEACMKCAQACEECFTACLHDTDIQARANMLKLLNDCSEMCFQTVQFMARNSTFSKALQAVCVQICEACAMECEKFNDMHSQECAKVCRQCADACRQMAS
jgi:hypothetical protein